MKNAVSSSPPPSSTSTSEPGTLKSTLMIATANGGRIAPREADPFMSKIPTNHPQVIDTPESGYSALKGASVSSNIDNKVTSHTVKDDGTWEASNLPAGTHDFIVSGNGKQVTVPITITSGKEHNQLTLITESDSGEWLAEGQTIHSDGSDGYKKETHHDGTSDTVFENGTRDHHRADGDTLRDVTDDGIVDQRFYDPDDDGVPDGPIYAEGGEPVTTQQATSTYVNNSPPNIKSINPKDNDGKKSNIVETDGSLQLELDYEDTDGDSLTVKWTVEDAEGNDVTSQFLDSSNIISPTFSPPQGDYSKPGAYIVTTTLTDPDGATTDKDIILTVDSPDNKAPHASIKANHTSGEAPLTVTFTCNAFDKDGTIVSYCWDFDKSNGIDQSNCDDTQPEVTKTFISEGKYRVTCIVTDDKGAVGFDKRVVVVRKKNEPPQVTDISTDKTEVSTGETVKVTVQTNDPDGDSLDVEISSEDGSVTDADASDGEGQWVAPDKEGEYVIEGKADDDTEQDREFTKIRVESETNKPPSVTGTASPESGGAALAVTLTATAQDEDGSIASVTWDFDDTDGIQIEASGDTANVAYGGPGEYVATVKACDDDGACAKDKIKITVTQPNRPPFVSSCSAAASSAETGEAVALIVQASDEDSDDLTYSWSVADGSLSSTTDLMPTWTLPATYGEHTATVSVSDGTESVTCDATLTVDPKTTGSKPLKPDDCTATGGNASAVVQWDASPSTDVDYYKVTRSSDGESFSVVQDNIPLSTRLMDDSGLTNGQTYEYQVIAVDTEGYESDPCEENMDAVPQDSIDEVVTVGEEPSDAEYDPTTDKIYVPNEEDDTVSVIDESTGKVIAEIVVGDQPVDACIDVTSSEVYIANRGDGTVSVIDETTDTVASTVTVGNGPNGCEVNTVKKEVFVSNEDDNTISIIDAETKTVKETVSTGNKPQVCDVNEDTNDVFVTNRDDGTLTIFDGKTRTAECTVTVGTWPAGCAVNNTTKKIDCTDPRPEICLDVWTPVCTSNGDTVSNGCYACRDESVSWYRKGDCDSSGDVGDVYVPIYNDGVVKIIDGNRCEVTDTVDVGGNPYCGCEVNRTSNQIYITNKSKNTVHLFNGATKAVEKTITVGKKPGGTCVDEARDKICVANKDSDTVTIINNPLPEVITDPFPPELIEGCVAIAKKDEVKIKWEPAEDDDFARYNLRRAASEAGPYITLTTLDSLTEFVDDSIANGTKYYYKVTAEDWNNNESDACMDDATPEEEVEEVIEIGGGGVCCMDTYETQIFVANEVTNTVEVISKETFQTITTINLHEYFDYCCGDVEVNHVTQKVYVTNKIGNKMVIIDIVNNIIEEVVDIFTTTIVDGGGGKVIVDEETVYLEEIESGRCIINETTNEIYIVNEFDNEIIVYNPDTYEKRTIYIGDGACPCDVEVDKVTNKVYVTNKTSNKLTVIDGTNYLIEEIIDLGDEGVGCCPGDCIINEVTSELYITNESTNEMVVYNTKTKKITKHITIGSPPSCNPCAVNTDSNQFYVSLPYYDAIQIIDGSNYTLADSVSVGDNPGAVAVDPDTNTLYVLNNGDDTISVVANPLPPTPSDTFAPDTPAGVKAVSEDNTVTISWDANIESDLVYYNVYRKTDPDADFGDPPTSVINNTHTDSDVSGGTTYYYAVTAVDNSANESDKSATVSGRPDVPTQITVGEFPCNAVADETLDRVFVSNRDSDTATIIDANTHTAVGTVNTGSLPWGIDADSSTGKVYVANLSSLPGSITVFDGSTGGVTATALTGGTALSGVAVDEANGFYYVSHANLSNGTVAVMDISTDAAVTSITTQSGSSGIAVNGTTRRVYVANSLDKTVSVIDATTDTLITNIDVDSQPTDVVIDEAANRVYVSCTGTGRVMVIDGSSDTLLTKIDVGLEPLGLGIDATRNYVYVANGSSGSVSVIDTAGNLVVGEIEVDGDPADVAVHSGLNKIFVPLKTLGKVVIRDGL